MNIFIDVKWATECIPLLEKTPVLGCILRFGYKLNLNVLLACSSSFLSSRRALFEPSFLFQVILYQGGQIFGGAPQFYGRVGFAVTMPTTSASIFINNTQLSDTGTYQCLVNNLPDRGVRNIGVIGLTVLGVFIGIMGKGGGE